MRYEKRPIIFGSTFLSEEANTYITWESYIPGDNAIISFYDEYTNSKVRLNINTNNYNVNDAFCSEIVAGWTVQSFRKNRDIEHELDSALEILRKEGKI